ncbi:MAG: DUF4062 domain-containing protein [bacterium]
MSMGTVPTVFVSSTCFDLKQVRSDLHDYLEGLGLQPIISEHRSFPIDPNINAVENCLKVVEERADIMLLIVGGRYGSPTEHGKSVTNLEYLRAKAKNIPIYVFVQNSILNILPVWKNNPDGNYEGIVDSNELFKFVELLKDAENVWIVGFDVAQDICSMLRQQLAYLFKESIDLRQRIRNDAIPDALQHFTGTPLRIVIERGIAWEYRLFAHLLVQEIEKAKQERWDLHYGIVFGQGEYLDDPPKVFNWIQRKLAEQKRFIDVTENIVNRALQEAFGEPGVAGDPLKIVYATQRLAAAYRSGIEWGIDARRVAVKKRFQEMIDTLATFPENMIKEIEEYSQRCVTSIEEAIVNLPGPDEPKREIVLTLTLTMAGAEEFGEACRKLAEQGFFEDDDDKDNE